MILIAHKFYKDYNRNLVECKLKFQIDAMTRLVKFGKLHSHSLDPARHAGGAGEVSGWADDLRGGAPQP